MRVAPYYLGITKPDLTAQFTTVFGTIISPLSKGSIEIVSHSTEDLPLVDLAYFSDPGEMQQAIAAVKRIRDLYASSSLSSPLKGRSLCQAQMSPLTLISRTTFERTLAPF